MARPGEASRIYVPLARIGAGLLLISVVGACRPGHDTDAVEAPPESPRHTAPHTQEPVEIVDSAADAGPVDSVGRPRAGTLADDEEAKFGEQRRRMVAQHIVAWGIDNPRVIEALRRVPRHRFVGSAYRDLAYVNSPLPIGHGQTISQPYIVALMTQLVEPKPGSKVLDVGTGSGYQAAVLAEIASRVFSIEIVEALARDAEARLRSLGYENVAVRAGDGYRGWPEQAPFDAIIVAAAPNHIPQPLVAQLAPGGKMVIPVGDEYQELILIEKSAEGTVTQQTVVPVAFVPMTGEAEKSHSVEP